MNSSLKAGVLAGLVAGLVAGIVGAISTVLVMVAGLPYYYLSKPFEIPVTKILNIEIILSMIFGIILSIIFMKAYDVIPGKRVTKYIVYGLFCHLIVGIREASFSIIYFGTTVRTLFDNASWIIIGFPQWIGYALVVGFLYEFLGSKGYIDLTGKKAVTYDMIGGAQVGAIVGMVGGIVAAIFVMIYEYSVGWSLVLPTIQDSMIIVNRFGAHAFWHLLYGAIFGAVFARAYGVIPGKGVIKGLFYGYTIFLISTVHQGALSLGYGLIQPLGILVPLYSIELKEIRLIVGWEWIIVDVFVYAVYGFLIGYLYRKPSE